MYNPSYVDFGTSQGWRCPGCGRYYSPTTSMCFYCGGNQKVYNAPNTSPFLSDANWWEEYLKRNTTGHPPSDMNCATTIANPNIKQEIRIGSDSITAKTDENVTVTIHNNSSKAITTTCNIDCDECEKHNESCWLGIETITSDSGEKAIISHRKPLEIHYPSTVQEWFEVFNG